MKMHPVHSRSPRARRFGLESLEGRTLFAAPTVIDVMVVYGPEYDMWLEGIDPELQAGMARAYNRWGQEMRETSKSGAAAGEATKATTRAKATRKATAPAARKATKAKATKAKATKRKSSSRA